MRVNMLKMQEQNQQLASANAQMLVVCLFWIIYVVLEFMEVYYCIFWYWFNGFQELNSGKDRVGATITFSLHFYMVSLFLVIMLTSLLFQEKKLQHELGCINGLLQARKPELEVCMLILLQPVTCKTALVSHVKLCSSVSQGNAITKPSINVDAQVPSTSNNYCVCIDQPMFTSVF